MSNEQFLAVEWSHNSLITSLTIQQQARALKSG